MVISTHLCSKWPSSTLRGQVPLASCLTRSSQIIDRYAGVCKNPSIQNFTTVGILQPLLENNIYCTPCSRVLFPSSIKNGILLNRILSVLLGTASYKDSRSLLMGWAWLIEHCSRNNKLCSSRVSPKGQRGSLLVSPPRGPQAAAAWSWTSHLRSHVQSPVLVASFPQAFILSPVQAHSAQSCSGENCPYRSPTSVPQCGLEQPCWIQFALLKGQHPMPCALWDEEHRAFPSHYQLKAYSVIR